MIDFILDFAIDHAPVFAALLTVVVVSAASAAIWAYGCVHDRAVRRRDDRVIS